MATGTISTNTLVKCEFCKESFLTPKPKGKNRGFTKLISKQSCSHYFHYLCVVKASVKLDCKFIAHCPTDNGLIEMSRPK